MTTESPKLHVIDATTNGAAAAQEDDIFADLEACRLSPDEAGGIGSEEIIVSIEVRKPKAHEFVRVDPRPEMSYATAIYMDADRNSYFVARPELRELLIDGCKAALLVPAVNMRGVHFIWPLMLGDGSGRRNAWHEGAREAAELAKGQWVKIVANVTDGGYRIYRARGTNLKDPVFLEKSLSELLRLAFRGRVIDGEDHPAIKAALGII
jgi:hypothetical protein